MRRSAAVRVSNAARKRGCVAHVCRAALVLGVLAAAQSAQASPTAIVDPKLTRAFALGGARGDGGAFVPFGLAGAPVVIVMRSPPSPESFDQLTQAGAELLVEAGAAPIAFDRFAPAYIAPGALSQIAILPFIERIDLAPRPGLRPDFAADLIAVDGARGARPALDLITGAGITIADLDSDADIYHPAFFRGDAGYFDWLDVDNDGTFTPGIDAIDLDRDGRASAAETAVLLRSELTFGPMSKVASGARSTRFDPGLDWVYLDQNGSSTRDFGVESGFTEATPAYGEPLFAPDDLNRSGTLDVGERLVRLGTSKLRSLRAPSDTGTRHAFRRGVDLSRYRLWAPTREALHATGSLSIMAGDLALAGRTQVGVAPDADLVLAVDRDDGPMASFAWALGERPDVIVHESASLTGTPLDGSDAYAALIDQASATIAQVCPAGNAAASKKHAHVTVDRGANVALSFVVPAPKNRPLGYAELSINARGGTLRYALRDPSGTLSPIGNNGCAITLDASAVAKAIATVERTSRGTDFIDIALQSSSPDQHPIPSGTWQLIVEGDPLGDATVDAYLTDERAGWSEGVAWADPSRTHKDSTLASPATADGCLAVGAHAGHGTDRNAPWYDAGDGVATGAVRDYSGRGPRIDGALKLGVSGPDNAWAANGWSRGTLYAAPYASLSPFGGTSAAGAHVAGVAALLAQVGVRATEATDAIRHGAVSDALTGITPNAQSGAGRLSASGAIGGATNGQPPAIALVAEGTGLVMPTTSHGAYHAPVGSVITLRADGPGALLEAKWDDGYDGVWDTPYLASHTYVVRTHSKGIFSYKVRVRDASGRFSEALVRIAVVDALAPPSKGTGDPLAEERTISDAAGASGADAASIVTESPRHAAKAQGEGGAASALEAAALRTDETSAPLGCSLPGSPMHPPMAPLVFSYLLVALRRAGARRRFCDNENDTH